MMVCELQHESRCERRGLHHGDVEEPDQTSSGGRPLMRLPGGGCLRQPEAGGESVGCGADQFLCLCAVARGLEGLIGRPCSGTGEVVRRARRTGGGRHDECGQASSPRHHGHQLKGRCCCTAATGRRDDGRPAGQWQWLAQCPVQVACAAPFTHRAAQKDP